MATSVLSQNTETGISESLIYFLVILFTPLRQTQQNLFIHKIKVMYNLQLTGRYTIKYSYVKLLTLGMISWVSGCQALLGVVHVFFTSHLRVFSLLVMSLPSKMMLNSCLLFVAGISPTEYWLISCLSVPSIFHDVLMMTAYFSLVRYWRTWESCTKSYTECGSDICLSTC